MFKFVPALFSIMDKLNKDNKKGWTYKEFKEIIDTLKKEFVF